MWIVRCCVVSFLITSVPTATTNAFAEDAGRPTSTGGKGRGNRAQLAEGLLYADDLAAFLRRRRPCWAYLFASSPWIGEANDAPQVAGKQVFCIFDASPANGVTNAGAGCMAGLYDAESNDYEELRLFGQTFEALGGQSLITGSGCSRSSVEQLVDRLGKMSKLIGVPQNGGFVVAQFGIAPDIDRTNFHFGGAGGATLENLVRTQACQAVRREAIRSTLKCSGPNEATESAPPKPGRSDSPAGENEVEYHLENIYAAVTKNIKAQQLASEALDTARRAGFERDTPPFFKVWCPRDAELYSASSNLDSALADARARLSRPALDKLRSRLSVMIEESWMNSPYVAGAGARLVRELFSRAPARLGRSAKCSGPEYVVQNEDAGSQVAGKAEPKPTLRTGKVGAQASPPMKLPIPANEETPTSDTKTLVAHGQVRFIVRPWATVRCGSHRLGDTPFGDVSLPSGTYTCTFKNPDHGTKAVEVNVVPNELSTVRVTF